MPGSTYTSWLVDMYAAYSEHVRNAGHENAQAIYQFAPNHLSEARPDIHGELVGTDHDCYHTGDLTIYLNQVYRLWNERKAFTQKAYEGLIQKLASQVEYTPGPRYDTEHDWFAEVSGYDTHGQARLSDDEEDLLRQIKGYPR